MEGLRERGYVEGQDFIVEYRSAEGREARLSEIATELVRLKVDVIVADSNAATDAAMKATTTIPIVFLHGDPLRSGVVPSLANHGTNLTGLSSLSGQLAAKRLELFKDAVPKLKRVAVLLNPEAPIHTAQFSDMQVIAQSLAVQLQTVELRDADNNFDSIFRQAIARGAHGLLILPSPIVAFHRRTVVDLAAQNRLPTMYPFIGFTETGGLMSYGPNSTHQYRRAAYFVDRILKGAKPSDLPVEQPTKFELAINLNTATTLGLRIPANVLMWTDRVISDRDPISKATVATRASGRITRPSVKIPSIGVLSPGSDGGPALEAFKQKLRELGYVEGENISLDYRWAHGDENRLSALAAELLHMNVDIIVATSALAARAAQRLTMATPIIATATSDPIGMALVKSLGQPGGNITGLSNMGAELAGKRLELLKEITPKISRVAVLARLGKVDPARETSIKEIQAVAQSLSVQLQILNVDKSDEIEDAFAAMLREKAGALTVLTQSMLLRSGKRIVDLAAKSRLPAMYPRSEYVEFGGLISYGPDRLADHRRAAYFVDKILKGAKPADLPFEQPTKFELVDCNT
jgi:putative ABC transport system substrate-binding protein